MTLKKAGAIGAPAFFFINQWVEVAGGCSVLRRYHVGIATVGNLKKAFVSGPRGVAPIKGWLASDPKERLGRQPSCF